MRKKIQNYLPEPPRFRDKDQLHTRVIPEELVLLDGETLLVVASRNAGLAEGSSLLEAVALPSDEIAFLKKNLAAKGRVLLCGEGCAVAVFGELNDETGLLAALILRGSDGERLSWMGRGVGLYGLTPSPAAQRQCRAARQTSENEERSESDGLESLSVLLQRSLAISLSARMRRIADLAGIAMETSSALPLPQALSISEQMRLTAFLLCLLVTLRHRDGRMLDMSDRGGNAFQGYRLEWVASHTSEAKRKARTAEAIPAFAEIGADTAFSATEFALPECLKRSYFQDFRLTLSDSSISVEIPLHPSPFRVRAASQPSVTWLTLRLTPLSNG